MDLLCYNKQRSERTKSEMREWRNRQPRTFEGRVVIPYGFKSRLSHQRGFRKESSFALCGYGGIGRRVRFRF